MQATEPELPARRTIHAWVKTRPDFERAYYIALDGVRDRSRRRDD
jgi:hypothetical protein